MVPLKDTPSRVILSKVTNLNLDLKPSMCMFSMFLVMACLQPFFVNFFRQQQPDNSKGAASGGCMACLAGICLCCCAEGAFPASCSELRRSADGMGQKFATAYSKPRMSERVLCVSLPMM